MNGNTHRCSSSSWPPSSRAWLTGPVPYFSRVPSPSSLIRATASTMSPWRTSEFHLASVSVRDATYFGMALSRSAMSPSRSGQESAKTS